MAEGDFPTDQSGQLKEAEAALEKYKKKLEEVAKTEGARRSEIEAFRATYGEILEQEDAQRTASLERRKRQLDEDIALSTGARKKINEAEREFVKESIDLNKERAEELSKSIDLEVGLFGDLSSAMDEATKKLQELGLGGAAASAAMAATVAVAGQLGMGIARTKKEIVKQIVEFDNARRSLIPYTQGLQGSIALQAQLIEKAKELQMPIEDVAKFVGTASDEFRMLNMENDEAIASLAGFSAIMDKLGASGTANIIEQMVTTGGMKNIEEAKTGLSSLTMQMSELGVLPKELAKDYAQVIPQMAMFGAQAGANIGKLSLMAKKARVDIGTLQGFAERFSGYSDAARSAQAINAVFGKPVIRNPAELVTAYYTLGEPGVLELVQNKLIQAGIDIDPNTAAGRTKIAFLAKQFGMTRDETMRVFGSDEMITAEEAEQITSAATPAAGGVATELQQKAAEQFANLANKTVTLAERLESLSERAIVGSLQGGGVDFQNFGPNLEKGINITIDAMKNFKGGADKAAEALGVTIPDGVKEILGAIRDRVNNPEIIRTDIEELTGETQALNAPVQPVATIRSAQDPEQTMQNATQMATAFVNELEKRGSKEPINIYTTVKLDGKVVGQAAEQYLNKKYV